MKKNTKKIGAILLSDAMIFIVAVFILMFVGIIGFSPAKDTARNTTAKTETAQIMAAISQYKYEMRSFPASLSVLTVKDGQYEP